MHTGIVRGITLLFRLWLQFLEDFVEPLDEEIDVRLLHADGSGSSEVRARVAVTVGAEALEDVTAHFLQVSFAHDSAKKKFS